MFRVTFLVDDPAERQRLATELRLLTVGSEARMVSAFTDAKTIEVYLDIAESADPRAVTDRFAQRLGVSDYELTRAEPLVTEPDENAPPSNRGRLHPATINQVRVHPDGRTLSVQARHRPDETVERVEIGETDEAVAITVLVSAPDDVRDQFVSFAVAFTWVEALLDSPMRDGQIIRHDRDPGPLPSRAFQRGSSI
jgi:hypothetical protein